MEKFESKKNAEISPSYFNFYTGLNMLQTTKKKEL